MKPFPFLPPFAGGQLTTRDGAQMPYALIGEGPQQIVVVPGAGDGLTLVNNAALQLAWFYRPRAGRYRILVLGRRQPVKVDGCIEDHADDMIWAVEQLGWGSSVWELNSAGGPVGQWIAVKRPDLVDGLILSVTLHRTAESTRRVLQHWIALSEAGRWADMAWSSIEYTFTPRKVRQYRPFRRLLGAISSRQKHPERLPRILRELLDLDQRDLLPQIRCPALVIGGEGDRVVPADIQREMAALIPNSELILYPGYGHGNDQENPDYERQVDRFVSAVARS